MTGDPTPPVPYICLDYALIPCVVGLFNVVPCTNCPRCSILCDWTLPLLYHTPTVPLPLHSRYPCPYGLDDVALWLHLAPTTRLRCPPHALCQLQDSYYLVRNSPFPVDTHVTHPIAVVDPVYPTFPTCHCLRGLLHATPRLLPHFTFSTVYDHGCLLCGAVPL